MQISYPIVIGDDVWWQESRPDEGGRVTVVHCGPDGKQRAVLAAPWNARTRVHEYGGLSYLPLPRRGPGGAPAGNGAIVFANYADQRLYLVPQAQVEARVGAGASQYARTRTRARSPRSQRG